MSVGIGDERYRAAVQFLEVGRVAEGLFLAELRILRCPLGLDDRDVYFWESDFYPPLQVHGFPTPDDLEWLDQRRAGRKPLSVEMINTEIVERDYQLAAIRTVLEVPCALALCKRDVR